MPEWLKWLIKLIFEAKISNNNWFHLFYYKDLFFKFIAILISEWHTHMSENINGYLKKINYNMNLRQKNSKDG